MPCHDLDHLSNRIAWTLSHTPKAILDNSILRYPKSSLVPITPLYNRTSSSMPNIGKLSILPIEIIEKIITHCTFTTLGALRLTCYQLKSTLDNLPSFKFVLRHAENVIRAFYDTKTVDYHSLSTIATALNETRCYYCTGKNKDFAKFLMLITCQRVCFNCLYRNPSCRLVALGAWERFFKIKVTGRVKGMASVPGIYCWGELIVPDHDRGMEAGMLTDILELEDCGTYRDEPRDAVADMTSVDVFRYRCIGATLITQSTAHTGASDIGGSWCKGCEIAYDRWLEMERNPELRSPDWVGGWQGMESVEANMLRARNTDEFLEHVKVCENAKKLLQPNGENETMFLMWRWGPCEGCEEDCRKFWEDMLS
ncbi:hypothetical protein B0J14DRAFT_640326 [Halenospora varia]|nr:hypothetical protein B0J14DRAFT_640326 [Halenospora varia]